MFILRLSEGCPFFSTPKFESGGGVQISWVWSFPRTKQKVFSGTKIYLIGILSVMFEFSATFEFLDPIFEFWRRYFDFWGQNLEIMT